MIEIEFSSEDIEALSYERYYHPHSLAQRRMEVVWLKSQGLSHKEICRLGRVSGNTLRNYLSLYKQGGIEELKKIMCIGQSSELRNHSDSIESHFREHPPSSIKEAVVVIEKLTGIRRSEQRVRVFLKSIGMDRRKIGMVPSKADLDKQETFKKKS